MADFERYKTITLVLIGILVSAKALQVSQLIISSWAKIEQWSVASQLRLRITPVRDGVTSVAHPTDQTRDIIPVRSKLPITHTERMANVAFGRPSRDTFIHTMITGETSRYTRVQYPQKDSRRHC